MKVDHKDGGVRQGADSFKALALEEVRYPRRHKALSNHVKTNQARPKRVDILSDIQLVREVLIFCKYSIMSCTLVEGLSVSIFLAAWQTLIA